MKIIADTNCPAEENCSRRQNVGKNPFMLPDKKRTVLKTSSSFTYSSNLSRSYVEQVSNVSWYRTKCGRPRSNSYPFIKRWNPLPRVIEEEESVEEAPKEAHRCVSNVHVQTINWADNKLSEEWLSKINLLRSTLIAAPVIKVRRRRSRSNSFPFIKRLHQLPCVTEEDETTEDEITTQLQQIQKVKRTDKLSHDSLDKISTESFSLSTTDKPRGPFHSVNYPLTKFTGGEKQVVLEDSRQNASISFERAVIRLTDQDSSDPASSKKDSSTFRKPDSTYISLISAVSCMKQSKEHNTAERILIQANLSPLIVENRVGRKIVKPWNALHFHQGNFCVRTDDKTFNVSCLEVQSISRCRCNCTRRSDPPIFNWILDSIRFSQIQ